MREMDVKARGHVYVSGRVQGVFFRSNLQKEAERRNITGWVRNLHNGRVEAVFEGEKFDVDHLIEFCKRGPSGAIITNIEVFWERYTGEFKNFKIRYSL